MFAASMCKSCVLPARLQLPSEIPVHHINSGAELANLVADLLSNYVVLALDAEWRPGSVEPALLQVACEDRVALVDLAALRGDSTAPAALYTLLTDPAVLRIGWRFASDLKMLGASMPCLDRVEGYVELADAPVPDAKSAGLAGYARALLSLDLCKAQQCSDWEVRPLTAEQVEYAALDVYSLLLMAERIEVDLPGPVVLTPSTGTTNNGGSGSNGGRAKEKENFLPRPSKSLRLNAAKREAFIARFCVKNQAYSNCRILSSNGDLVAHCDRSKALWYLSKGLASHVSGSCKRGPVPASTPDRTDTEPLTVRLTFSPEERHDGSFEQLASPQPRRNRCVVCGTEESLSRYHLVPRSYQRFFKLEYKAKQSTDIVLLCVDCHEVANRHVMVLKLRIAKEYSAPLQGEGLIKPTRAERTVVKSAAALLRGGDAIPPPRMAELKATVRAWWSGELADGRIPATLVHVDALDPAALQHAARLGRSPERKGGWQAAMSAAGEFRPHGQIVVDALHADPSDDALHEFIVRWRRHFVSSLAPRYMPHDWHMLHRRTPTRIIVAPPLPAQLAVPTVAMATVEKTTKACRLPESRPLVIL